MSILTGIQNFVDFIHENWTMITSIITIILIIWKKAKTYLSMSKDEKVTVAKAQIREIMLRLVTEAECDYSEWIKAGSIKRSQVIDEIFTMYPILSEVANQQEIIKWLDDMIVEALKEMRKIFEENKEKSENTADCDNVCVSE